MNYKDKRWVKKRVEVFKRDLFKCRGCSSEDNLQCHHSYYVSGRKLWEYPMQSFITLCENCHTEYHDQIKGKDLVIKDPVQIKLKLQEEKLLGFNYINTKNVKKKVLKPVINKKPKFNKSKYKKEKAEAKKNEPETIQQRRNRLIVPQWKIDEYKAQNK